MKPLCKESIQICQYSYDERLELKNIEDRKGTVGATLLVYTETWCKVEKAAHWVMQSLWNVAWRGGGIFFGGGNKFSSSTKPSSGLGWEDWQLGAGPPFPWAISCCICSRPWGQSIWEGLLEQDREPYWAEAWRQERKHERWRK